jgi:hypothetical protein
MNFCEMQFTCIQQRLKRTDKLSVVADAKQKIRANFVLCATWRDMNTYVRFDCEAVGKLLDVPLVDGCVMVPWEVLAQAGTFDVALFAEGANGERMTSNRVTVSVERSIDYQDNPPVPYEPDEPTASLLQSIESKAAAAAESAEAAEASAAAAADSAANATAATVEVGSVTAGDTASVTNSGDEKNAVLDFVLPRGEAGKDGADGKDGSNGADGKTPVRGTDYWTEADVAEIKGYVDAAILGGAW